ncbi:site-2 protease family protein [Candidatus Daviesbacteria bacterium]|nr:site-2 protease family protein [Candidatus Daviesbacteria bacterium]
MIISIIIFIITLLVLVLIHELGHFLLAKKFNIKVLEFGFGIPPRAWGKKIGETIYSVNWLPLGGFVRLLGEDEVDKETLEDKRSFSAQSVSKRILVVVAGVSMTLIFAWLLFYIVLGFGGFKTQIPLILEHQFTGVVQKEESFVVIAQVAKDSPAEGAGIKSGERVVSINEEMIEDDRQLVEKTKSLAGAEIELKLADLQNKQTHTIRVTPRLNPPEGEGPLGIALMQFELANLEFQTPLQKIFSAPIHSWNLVAYSSKIFSKLISQSLAQKDVEPLSKSVAGPVGITSLANTILTSTDSPFLPYLDFVAILSLNLAVINLLPIPALDGGRLIFLMIEAVTRKRVHAKVEKWIHTVGMALLLTLAILITFSDIKKILY